MNREYTTEKTRNYIITFLGLLIILATVCYLGTEAWSDGLLSSAEADAIRETSQANSLATKVTASSQADATRMAAAGQARLDAALANALLITATLPWGITFIFSIVVIVVGMFSGMFLCTLVYLGGKVLGRTTNNVTNNYIMLPATTSRRDAWIQAMQLNKLSSGDENNWSLHSISKEKQRMR